MTTAREVFDAAISERDFARSVTDAAKLLGWRVQYHWSERHSPAGWPDLSLVRDGRLIFAELKSERGRLSPAQISWLAELRKTKAEIYIWRPSNWDELIEVLR